MYLSANFMMIGNDRYDMKTILIVFLISTLLLALPAWYITKDLFRPEIDCEICNGKKTQIKLDRPEALEIIKKHDLKIPEEVVSKKEKKQPWQT